MKKIIKTSVAFIVSIGLMYTLNIRADFHMMWNYITAKRNQV